MLTSYEGTVLFVSHDRYFINQVATGILEFGESDVQFYGMNYAQYLEEIKRQTPGRETGNAGGVVRNRPTFRHWMMCLTKRDIITREKFCPA